MKALLIINPKAGRRKTSPLPDIKETFTKEPFFDLDVHETTGPGDATVAAGQAAAEGYDVVIAAGGDGSIFEVSNGLVGTEACLGVIPIGTENVLAREMGVPLDPRKATEHLIKTQPRLIDVGKVEDQYFVCFAGIGFDAHVAHNLPSERKKRFGALAYFYTSAEKLAEYRKTPHQAKVTLDGKEHEFEFLIFVISNIRTYGGGLLPAPEAKVDDGLLDVCVLPYAGYAKTMRQTVAMRSGKHIKLPGVEYFQAKDIVIETHESKQIQLDGDAWPGSSPFHISAVPRSLNVRF